MTLRETALQVAFILEKAPRTDRNGQVVPPESIDEPEGKVRVILTDRLANLLAHRLRLAIGDDENNAQR